MLVVATGLGIFFVLVWYRCFELLVEIALCLGMNLLLLRVVCVANTIVLRQWGIYRHVVCNQRHILVGWG